MRWISVVSCVLACCFSVDVKAGDLICDIAKNPSPYDGKAVVVRGDMFVGMHGSALFTRDCFETPMPIRIEPDSQAKRDFNGLYEHRDDGRRVEAGGVLHLEGHRYFLEVKSVRRVEVSQQKP